MQHNNQTRDIHYLNLHIKWIINITWNGTAITVVKLLFRTSRLAFILMMTIAWYPVPWVRLKLKVPDTLLSILKHCRSSTVAQTGMKEWWIKACRTTVMQLQLLPDSITAAKKHTIISAHVHLIPPFKHEMSFCRLTSGLTANTLEGGPTVYGRNTQSIAEQLIS